MGSARATYPRQGLATWAFKIEDADTTEVYPVDVDDSGALITLAPRHPGAHLELALYGKLSPVLSEQVEKLEPSERVPVSLRLVEPPPGASGSAARLTDSPALADASPAEVYAAIDTQRAQEVSALTGPALQRLQEAGIAAVAHEFVPLLDAELTAEQIQEVAAWDEVEQVDFAPPAIPALAIARQAVRAHVLQNRGATGAGVQLGQVEVEGRVRTDSSLPVEQLAAFDFSCLAISPHSTRVAGILRGTLAGIAPGASLVAAGS